MTDSSATRILALRETRNHVAHAVEDPPEEVVVRFEDEVRELMAGLEESTGQDC